MPRMACTVARLKRNRERLTIHRQCSILQLSAAILFSVLATRSRLRLSRATVQAIRGITLRCGDNYDSEWHDK
jgi:hypothetical protein